MQQIPFTKESFSAPRWVKIISYAMSLILLLAGVSLLMMKDVAWEIICLALLLFLIVVCMLIYTRLKLIISNTGIRFAGGFKQHNFLWTDITKVDMIRAGKYKTPIAVIYYSNKTLELHRGFYLPLKFNRILSLLEAKVAPDLFTEKYQDIRHQSN